MFSLLYKNFDTILQLNKDRNNKYYGYLQFLSIPSTPVYIYVYFYNMINEQVISCPKINEEYYIKVWLPEIGESNLNFMGMDNNNNELFIMKVLNNMLIQHL